LPLTLSAIVFIFTLLSLGPLSLSSLGSTRRIDRRRPERTYGPTSTWLPYRPPVTSEPESRPDPAREVVFEICNGAVTYGANLAVADVNFAVGAR